MAALNSHQGDNWRVKMFNLLGFVTFLVTVCLINIVQIPETTVLTENCGYCRWELVLNRQTVFPRCSCCRSSRRKVQGVVLPPSLNFASPTRIWPRSHFFSRCFPVSINGPCYFLIALFGHVFIGNLSCGSRAAVFLQARYDFICPGVKILTFSFYILVSGYFYCRLDFRFRATHDG